MDQLVKWSGKLVITAAKVPMKQEYKKDRGCAFFLTHAECDQIEQKSARSASLQATIKSLKDQLLENSEKTDLDEAKRVFHNNVAIDSTYETVISAARWMITCTVLGAKGRKMSVTCAILSSDIRYIMNDSFINDETTDQLRACIAMCINGPHCSKGSNKDAEESLQSLLNEIVDACRQLDQMCCSTISDRCHLFRVLFCLYEIHCCVGKRDHKIKYLALLQASGMKQLMEKIFDYLKQDQSGNWVDTVVAVEKGILTLINSDKIYAYKAGQKPDDITDVMIKFKIWCIAPWYNPPRPRFFAPGNVRVSETTGKSGSRPVSVTSQPRVTLHRRLVRETETRATTPPPASPAVGNENREFETELTYKDRAIETLF